MKRIFNSIMICAVLLTIGTMTSCKNSKGDKAEVTEAAKAAEATGKTFAVDNLASKVLWEGTKPTGSHSGSIDVSKGEISVKDGKVTAGNFTLDMNTISCLDLEGDSKAGLESHLKGTGEAEKNDHFFNVNKFPTATFEITKVAGLANNAEANSLVYGNLTMKDVTKQVQFKANIDMQDSKVVVSAPLFTINRTEWNVTYGSKSVFDNLKDKFINDDIGLQIQLSANMK